MSFPVRLEDESVTNQLDRWIEAEGGPRHALNAALSQLADAESCIDDMRGDLIEATEHTRTWKRRMEEVWQTINDTSLSNGQRGAFVYLRVRDWLGYEEAA